MSAAPSTTALRPTRWGLAVKLFAILLLLGGIAVLVTGYLGYIRARDTLEDSILNQLSAARQTKARQIEAYFRSVSNDLRVLASSKMVVEAMHGFTQTFQELDQKNADPTIEPKMREWYAKRVMPTVQRVPGADATETDYFPHGAAANYLQYHYIVANPQSSSRRRLMNDAGDGSAYSAVHAIYHPMLRQAASIVGFFDFMLVDTTSQRVVYDVAKEIDFGTSLLTGPYRSSNLAAAVARCSVTADASATCLEDFAPYVPSDGQPINFMTAPIIDKGTVIGVLVAQLSIEEIDRVVTGDRRWREEGFGVTGETYIVGLDSLVRSGARLFHEDRDRYFAELAASGAPASEIDAIRRYGSPVLHQKIDTQGTRAALAGIEGSGEIVGNLGKRTLSSWGPLNIPGVKWAAVSKIEVSEAFAPVYHLQRDLVIVGAIAFAVVVVTGAWLSRSLLGPLRELTAGVERFAGGDYGAHVTVRTQDEIGALCAAFNGMVDELRDKNAVIEEKNRENEELLLNVLPAPIANRLREGEASIADGFANVTVLFADIVGFTEMSSEMPPQNVVALLNGLFTRFDVAAQELGIEKIKTVGDAYMAVCGLPEPNADHTERMVRMAIRMVHITREHALENRVALQLRVGVNSGPVVAGVIGKSKYIYDLWGDTVNLASRMESGGLPGAIQVTRPIFEQLKDKFAFEARGPIEVKGKGEVEAWLLRL
jgi:class 3 adenylate cyclase